jgi:NAD dependent epimerase/dehydratase family enzyme
MEIEQAARAVMTSLKQHVNSQPQQQETHQLPTLSLLRIGHVLHESGGLLPYLSLASRLHIEKMGDGNQYVPWISMDDLCKAVVHISDHHVSFNGPVNVVAPNSCTNIELMRALSAQRNSSFLLPLAKVVLDAVVGDSSCILTDSERVQPSLLTQSHSCHQSFEFQHKTIGEFFRLK